MNDSFIKVVKVSKKYVSPRFSVEALKGVSFEIIRGEILGLLGINGAGKTTLASILSGLHAPSAGDILCNGSSIYQDIASYKRIIGLCPQKPNLDMSLSVEQNLLFAGRYYGLSSQEIQQHLEKLLNQFGLNHYAKASPYALSGGFKQRFLLARTLMHQPQLIILDEPTMGLDVQVRHQLWECVRLLKQEGKTILLTTHYMEEAEKLSDRVCIIESGLVKSIDTPQNLKTVHQKTSLEEVFLKLLDKREPIGIQR